MLVAVYGTLLKGLGNHSVISQNAKGKFLNSGRTVDKMTMYAAGIPYVTKTQKTCPIKVEVYEVEANNISPVDRLEGHPNFYCREPVEIKMDDGKVVTAEIYLYNRVENRFNHKDMVINGDYANPKFPNTEEKIENA